MTSIVGGWDSEAELAVDGQVGQGPKSGSGGKVEGARAGGPGLYMIEPSGLYWVRKMFLHPEHSLTTGIGLLRCRHRQGTTGCESRAGEIGSELRQLVPS